MVFQAVRAAVVAGDPEVSGDAVVGRWPGVVCVAQCPDPEVLSRLLEVCAGVAGPAPGRMLARRLAMWLGGPDGPDDDLRFGTVATTGEQWAVFLSGAVALVVPERDLTLSGADAAAWTDRLLPPPGAPVALTLDGFVVPPDLTGGVHDLRAGVVPGAGVVLVPVGSEDVDEPVDEDRPGPARREPAGHATSPGPVDAHAEPDGAGAAYGERWDEPSYVGPPVSGGEWPGEPPAPEVAAEPAGEAPEWDGYDPGDAPSPWAVGTGRPADHGQREPAGSSGEPAWGAQPDPAGSSGEPAWGAEPDPAGDAADSAHDRPGALFGEAAPPAPARTEHDPEDPAAEPAHRPEADLPRPRVGEDRAGTASPAPSLWDAVPAGRVRNGSQDVWSYLGRGGRWFAPTSAAPVSARDVAAADPGARGVPPDDVSADDVAAGAAADAPAEDRSDDARPDEDRSDEALSGGSRSDEARSDEAGVSGAPFDRARFDDDLFGVARPRAFPQDPADPPAADAHTVADDEAGEDAAGADAGRDHDGDRADSAERADSTADAEADAEDRAGDRSDAGAGRDDALFADRTGSGAGRDGGLFDNAAHDRFADRAEGLFDDRAGGRAAPTAYYDSAYVGAGEAGADHSDADRPGSDHVGVDHVGVDHVGADHVGADHASADVPYPGAGPGDAVDAADRDGADAGVPSTRPDDGGTPGRTEAVHHLAERARPHDEADPDTDRNPAVPPLPQRSRHGQLDADPAETPTPAEPMVHAPQGPSPTPRARPRTPARAEQILGVDPAEPPRPPLDHGAPVGAVAVTEELRDAAPGRAQAHGHMCARGHLNDPRSHFCVLCGIRMNERTGVLVVGARPPLGLLVFDDGATYTVDDEYLVGRMPEADARVRSGALRSITVEDRSGAVSRVHAEVRVNGWDVLLVDSGSRNGTFVAAPGEQAWSRLPPRQSRRLVPGTRVRLGGRTFVFESPSGVR